MILHESMILCYKDCQPSNLVWLMEQIQVFEVLQEDNDDRQWLIEIVEEMVEQLVLF